MSGRAVEKGSFGAVGGVYSGMHEISNCDTREIVISR